MASFKAIITKQFSFTCREKILKNVQNCGEPTIKNPYCMTKNKEKYRFVKYYEVFLD